MTPILQNEIYSRARYRVMRNNVIVNREWIFVYLIDSQQVVAVDNRNDGAGSRERDPIG